MNWFWLMVVAALCAGCATDRPENTVKRGVVYCGSRMAIYNDATGVYHPPVPCIVWYFDWSNPKAI